MRLRVYEVKGLRSYGRRAEFVKGGIEVAISPQVDKHQAFRL